MGAKDISALFEYSEKTVADKFAEEKRNAEQRNIDHGEKLVSLFTEYPDLVSREKLKEYSDLFGFDYMMLFDTGGKEILSDSDYIGMTMDAGLGENSRDFRRLLLGVPSIIHEASTDPVTGLTRQFAGVRMPLTKPSGEPGYGAWYWGDTDERLGESIDAEEEEMETSARAGVKTLDAPKGPPKKRFTIWSEEPSRWRKKKK